MTNFANGGIETQLHCGSYEYAFYDKISDMERNKNARKYLTPRIKNLNVLRIEPRLNAPAAIETQFRQAGINVNEYSFKNLFSQRIARQVITHCWNEVKRNMPKRISSYKLSDFLLAVDEKKIDKRLRLFVINLLANELRTPTTKKLLRSLSDKRKAAALIKGGAECKFKDGVEFVEPTKEVSDKLRDFVRITPYNIKPFTMQERVELLKSIRKKVLRKKKKIQRNAESLEVEA